MPALHLLLAALQGSPPVATARRLDAAERVVLDGRLDETLWSRGEPITGLRQRDPDTGQPSLERTEVRFVYDGEYLYIGIRAGARAAPVTARVMQRDRLLRGGFGEGVTFGGDDAVAILLDPFHDHRNAFVFATNPNGAEFEALLTDEGREFNADWRTVWDVAAARSDSEWTAELAIPFRSLRYPTGSRPQVWGVNAARMVRARNEESLWSAWGREQGFARVSQAGHLAGLADLPHPSLAVDVKPYALTRASRDTAAIDGSAKAGLDVKWEVHPGLTLDVTTNTDFAQVEADSVQVNLTRFDLFFPEKREFFLENSGIFEFGAPGSFEPPPFLLFFSRRIGLSDSGAVPIIGGARLSGRLGGQTLGLLDAVTGQVVDQARSNYAVARYKRDVAGSGYVGAMVTDLRRADGHANTAGGLDASLWPTPRLNVQTFVAATTTRGPGGDGPAYRAAARYEAPRWNIAAVAFGVGPQTSADVGFITRGDLHRVESFGGVIARPPVLGLNRIDLFVDVNRAYRWAGEFQESWTGPGMSIDWRSGESVMAWWVAGRERIDTAFDLSDSIPVGPGTYDLTELAVFAQTAAHRPVALGLNGTWRREYGGEVGFAGGSVRVAPGRHLFLEIGGTRNWARLPAGSLTADLATLRLAWAFTTHLALNALAQYSSLDREASANVRLSYTFRPGSDLFVVVNEQRGSDTDAWAFASRGTALKVTYLWRF